MSDVSLVTRPQASLPTIWERVASIFLPQFRVARRFSLFEGEAEQIRKERPLLADFVEKLGVEADRDR